MAERMTGSGQQGFTLVEVMVAMGILSTVIAGTLVLMSGQLRAAGDIERRMIAGIVAENLLADAVADPAQPVLETEAGIEEMGGTAWAWVLVTAETPIDGMVRITVDIREEEGEQVIRSLTAFRTVN